MKNLSFCILFAVASLYSCNSGIKNLDVMGVWETDYSGYYITIEPNGNGEYYDGFWGRSGNFGWALRGDTLNGYKEGSFAEEDILFSYKVDSVTYDNKGTKKLRHLHVTPLFEDKMGYKKKEWDEVQEPIR